MSATAAAPSTSPSAARRFGIAWVLLVLTVALHVTDEALTGFLPIYNATATEIHQRWPWLHPPTFSFPVFVGALSAALAIALLLTPLAFRHPRGFRPFAIICAVLMILNGCNHIGGTILGHSFADIAFPRPMPGTYSSPTMIAASIYVLFAARKLRVNTAAR